MVLPEKPGKYDSELSTALHSLCFIERDFFRLTYTGEDWKLPYQCQTV